MVGLGLVPPVDATPVRHNTHTILLCLCRMMLRMSMFLSSFSPTSMPLLVPDMQGEYVSGYKQGLLIVYWGFSTNWCASRLELSRSCDDIAQQQDLAVARKRLDTNPRYGYPSPINTSFPFFRCPYLLCGFLCDTVLSSRFFHWHHEEERWSASITARQCGDDAQTGGWFIGTSN